MSLVARHLEANGFSTLCMASALDIIEAGRPPRTVFLNYPLGHTVGRPFDAEDQLRVVSDALRAFETIREPGEIVRLPYRWPDEHWVREASTDPLDSRSPRDTTPRYQTEEDRRLAEAS